MKNQGVIALTSICIEYDLGGFLRPKTFRRNKELDERIYVDVYHIDAYKRVHPVNQKITLRDRIFKPSHFIKIDLEPYTNISLIDGGYLKVKETPEEIETLLKTPFAQKAPLEDLYWVFIKEQHYRPKLNEKRFYTLQGMDFGRYILKPLSVYIGKQENEVALGKNLSYGQKSIYYWWYLDEQVTHGGFMQFFMNGYEKYIDVIAKGLEFVGDVSMANFLRQVKDYFCNNNTAIMDQMVVPESYKKVVEKGGLSVFDATYLSLHDATMHIIETYAKEHPEEFCVNFWGKAFKKRTQ